MVKAVLFDMIGTTVRSNDSDYIVTCFKKAFMEHNLIADEGIIKNNRGRNKLEMILTLLKNDTSTSQAESILRSFDRIVAEEIENFSEASDLPSVFKILKEKKILIGVGTGLSYSLFQEVYKHLNWKRHTIDYIGISETLGKSRPDPMMITDMMQKFKITNPKEFLKVGDTVADIQEGKNAGVYTAVVLAGTQTESELRLENPNYVLKQLSDVLSVDILNQ